MPGRSTPHQYRTAKSSRSHTSRVVDDLGLKIVSGEQQQGSLLPGDIELIERYGVSRTVLREALKTLSAKGLLQAKARIGTRVRPRSDWNLFDPDVLVWHARLGFTADFLEHLGEMRLALEPEAAALAAQRRTDAQLKAMRNWVEALGAGNISHNDFVHADLELHLAIAEAANNPFFVSISTLIEVALVAMMTVASPVADPTALAVSVREHTNIVDAIAKRDPEAARAAMKVVVRKGIDGSRGKSIPAPVPEPGRAGRRTAPA